MNQNCHYKRRWEKKELPEDALSSAPVPTKAEEGKKSRGQKMLLNKGQSSEEGLGNGFPALKNAEKGGLRDRERR